MLIPSAWLRAVSLAGLLCGVFKWRCVEGVNFDTPQAAACLAVGFKASRTCQTLSSVVQGQCIYGLQRRCILHLYSCHVLSCICLSGTRAVKGGPARGCGESDQRRAGIRYARLDVTPTSGIGSEGWAGLLLFDARQPKGPAWPSPCGSPAMDWQWSPLPVARCRTHRDYQHQPSAAGFVYTPQSCLVLLNSKAKIFASLFSWTCPCLLLLFIQRTVAPWFIPMPVGTAAHIYLPQKRALCGGHQ